jgi:putative transposase
VDSKGLTFTRRTKKKRHSIVKAWLDENATTHNTMSDLYQSLSHSKWDCKYHIVFIPKGRRKVLFGNIRKELGGIFHELARQKESKILEGHVMPDHVHMLVSIPPKYAVAAVIGFMKGKSAIAIARKYQGKERNYAGEHFWARGYAVSTAGFESNKSGSILKIRKRAEKVLFNP